MPSERGELTKAKQPQPRFGDVEQLFHLPMSDDGDFNRGEKNDVMNEDKQLDANALD